MRCSAVPGRLFVLLVAFGLLAAPGVHAQSAGSPADRWQFSITPYLWAPSIDGTLNFDVPSILGAHR